MATDQDMNRNPTGKGGFGDHPENRNPGGWRKEDTPRYKLEKMMKLNHKELQAFALDEEQPLFDRKLAKFIADGDWKTIKEMVAEVYGVPKQTIEQTVIEKPLPLEDLTNGIREDNSLPQNQETEQKD